MAFEDTVGLGEAVRGLRAALESGRLPHAWLLLGSPGAGRRAAQELARVLLCGQAEQAEGYCGRCEDCRLMEAGSHPDFFVHGVPPENVYLPIDTIRGVLHTASLRPVRAASRVFVIRDADRMTLEAANCFLKTLEEPPGDAVFLLVAASLRPIPETIVSRCRLLRVANPPPDVLRGRLEAEGVEPDEAHWLGRRCWGDPELAERFRGMELYGFNAELLRAVRDLGLEDNFRLSDRLEGLARQMGETSPEARDILQDLLECLALYYRDLAVLAASGAEGADLCNRARAEDLRAQAASADVDLCLERADLVLETIERVGANAYRPLALDHLFTALAARPDAARGGA